MRGGDNQAGFAIRNPLGQFVMPYQWKAHAEYDEAAIQTPGINIFSIIYFLLVF